MYKYLKISTKSRDDSGQGNRWTAAPLTTAKVRTLASKRVFFFLAWPQPDYISAQTLDFWSIIVFEELLLIYFTHLGLKQKFPPPYYFFRNTLWNFMEYFETYSFLGLL